MKEKSKVTQLAAEYGVELSDFPEEKDIKKVLTDKYKETLGVEAPVGLLPECKTTHWIFIEYMPKSVLISPNY